MQVTPRNVSAFLLIGALLLSAYGFMRLTEARTDALNAAMSRYEACVMREYRMTPTQYRATNGTLPICEH